jgi:serine protease Do
VTPEQVRQLRHSPGLAGALVEHVEPFTLAADEGIRRGDVILGVNRRPVCSANEAARELSQIKSSQPVFTSVATRQNQVFVQ